MNEMIGKVSLQEKIAELESRIAALEGRTFRTVTTTTVNRVAVNSNVFGEHWDKMWDEFHAMMKGVFKRD